MIAGQGAASWPAYEKPPILEASLTIQIAPLQPERFALLGGVGARLNGDFSKTQLLAQFSSKYLDVSAAASGMVYSTPDDKETVQARSDGFSYSRQAPYLGWESFLPRAQEAWRAYVSVVSPLTLKSVLLKYVNSIMFPLGLPLHDLFNTYPAVPNPSQLFDAISMFYKLRPPEAPWVQLSVLMTNLPTSGTTGHMLLDNTLQFVVQNENDIWPRMPELRKLKNDIFESQLTPTLKEQFK